MNNLKVNIVDENVFVLLEDVTVESMGRRITVKAGFDFDGASIPKAFWSVVGNPLTGKYRIAALVHDVLYASEKFPRELADEVFLDLMKQHGVGYVKRYTMYGAVRSAGWTVWRGHEESEIARYKEFINVEKIDS